MDTAPATCLMTMDGILSLRARVFGERPAAKSGETGRTLRTLRAAIGYWRGRHEDCRAVCGVTPTVGCGWARGDGSVSGDTMVHPDFRSQGCSPSWHGRHTRLLILAASILVFGFPMPIRTRLHINSWVERCLALRAAVFKTVSLRRVCSSGC
jgi:hypothetical protein